MNGGAVLQMDQATPANQAVLRHQRQRGQDPNLDRGERLRPRGHCQKGTGPRTEPLHFVTDSQPQPFRKNAHFSGFFGGRTD